MLTQSFFLSFIAVLFYSLAALRIYQDLKRGADAGTITATVSLFWILGLTAHALIITGFLTPEGLSLTFFHAISIVGLLLAIALLFGCFSQPLTTLGLIVLPMVSAFVILSALDENRYMFSNTATFGIRVHILGSFIAYGVLALACVLACALSIQRRRLHANHLNAVSDVLPPLEAMERFLILLLLIGVAFLSIGIISGLFIFDDILAQHLAHKTAFSLAAWAVYIGLLGSYFTNCLHSGKLVSLTIWGSVLLLLAYFGSKFVLEFLLTR